MKKGIPDVHPVNHLDNGDVVLHARINERKALQSLDSTESGRWSIKTDARCFYQGRVARRFPQTRACFFKMVF